MEATFIMQLTVLFSVGMSGMGDVVEFDELLS